MEEWQKEHIRRNLPQLIQATRCKNILLATLKQQDVLHSDDAEYITEIANTHTQATRLYEILGTRVGAFDSLLSALKTANQTGAFTILNSIYGSSPPYASLHRNITYDKNAMLGTGCNLTKVYKGWMGDRAVAVKVLDLDFLSKKAAFQEIEFLKTCDWHENIVRYFGAQVEDDKFLIAVELCETTLSSWAKPSDKHSPQMEVAVLRQATAGLNHLHSHQIIHRDIKPDNILLMKLPNERVRVKLTDFGYSRQLQDGKKYFTYRATSGIGSEEWSAPEILQNVCNENSSRAEVTPAIDIFSLGCVFYFLVSGGFHPFGNALRRANNILDGKQELIVEDIKPGHFPSMLLIKSMISMNPLKRPSCAAILSHPFFWDEDRTSQFLSEAANSSDDAQEIWVTQLELYGELILGRRGTLWMELLCPEVQEYVLISQSCFTNNTISSLLKTIVNLLQCGQPIPHTTKDALGETLRERLSYFKSRFPLFVDIVWMSFRELSSKKSSTDDQIYELIPDLDKLVDHVAEYLNGIPKTTLSIQNNTLLPSIEDATPYLSLTESPYDNTCEPQDNATATTLLKLPDPDQTSSLCICEERPKNDVTDDHHPADNPEEALTTSSENKTAHLQEPPREEGENCQQDLIPAAYKQTASSTTLVFTFENPTRSISIPDDMHNIANQQRQSTEHISLITPSLKRSVSTPTKTFVDSISETLESLNCFDPMCLLIKGFVIVICLIVAFFIIMRFVIKRE